MAVPITTPHQTSHQHKSKSKASEKQKGGKKSTTKREKEETIGIELLPRFEVSHHLLGTQPLFRQSQSASVVLAPTHSTTQRNATQRNATQRKPINRGKEGKRKGGSTDLASSSAGSSSATASLCAKARAVRSECECKTRAEESQKKKRRTYRLLFDFGVDRGRSARHSLQPAVQCSAVQRKFIQYISHTQTRTTSNTPLRQQLTLIS
jgi:hypothetical protein